MRMKIVSLAIIFVSLSVAAQEQEISLDKTDDALIETVTDLRKAVTEKDPYPIFRAVSKKFKIERDFGGISNENENSVVNFLRVFPLDGFGVREEYKNDGWEQLQNILSSNTLITRSKTNLCLANGHYMNNIILDELLCFTKSDFGVWQITSFVSAGD